MVEANNQDSKMSLISNQSSVGRPGKVSVSKKKVKEIKVSGSRQINLNNDFEQSIQKSESSDLNKNNKRYKWRTYKWVGILLNNYDYERER